MKTIADLRDNLFKVLDDLSDKNASAETIARAKAVSDIAQTIINTAKVEVDYIRAAGGKGGTGFLGAAAAPALPDKRDDKDVVERGKGYTVRRHRLEG